VLDPVDSVNEYSPLAALDILSVVYLDIPVKKNNI